MKERTLGYMRLRLEKTIANVTPKLTTAPIMLVMKPWSALLNVEESAVVSSKAVQGYQEETMPTRPKAPRRLRSLKNAAKG
ncbi:MAG: hypothetical protein ACE14S_09095 [Candidatus Bathyarchaeia archaeon]